MDKNYLTVLILLGGVVLCLVLFTFNQNIILEILIVISFTILFIMTGSHFISTNTSLSDIFGSTSSVNIIVDPTESDSTSGSTGSAYFIPGQYTYSEASSVCQKDNATLANIQQLNDAYNNGKEWCEYGWSDEMMALYPTQTTTWNQLKQKGQDSACGRPGVNGGYTNNPNLKLGVNCYK